MGFGCWRAHSPSRVNDDGWVARQGGWQWTVPGNAVLNYLLHRMVPYDPETPDCKRDKPVGLAAGSAIACTGLR